MAGLGQRFMAYVLEPILFILTLGIGYFIWLFFTLPKGQTPGKKVIGIRVARTNGEGAGLGKTLFREILAKPILTILVGWFFYIHILWALWDKNRQTLYDKFADTIVVHG